VLCKVSWLESLKVSPYLPEINLFPKKLFSDWFLISVILCNLTVSSSEVLKSIVRLLWKHLIYALSVACRVCNQHYMCCRHRAKGKT
jgi:hypothetical protein